LRNQRDVKLERITLHINGTRKIRFTVNPVVFTQFEELIDILTTKGFLEYDHITLDGVSETFEIWNEIQTSSSNGYPRSIIALLLTIRAGILVLPFLGN
jgi:hypothetical protein